MTGMDPATIVMLTGEGTTVHRRVALDLDQRGGRARWAMQLDAALRNEPAELIAVAEGLAAVALAYWMQLSPLGYLAALRGAVLHAPASASACATAGLGSLPTTHLSVRSIVVGRAGEDAAHHLSLADRWGARFVPDHQLARTVADDAIEARLLAVALTRSDAMPSPTPIESGDVVPIRTAI